MKSMVRIFVVCLSMLMIMGCFDVGRAPLSILDEYDRMLDGYSENVKVVFLHDFNADTSRSFSANMTPTITDTSLDPLRDFYETLGNRIGRYTPTEFKLYLHYVPKIL